ncbi:hypothetical protein MVI01_35810 [Myxococcus virescens]|uniref:Uncharacterized protein n=1 Tax=Myxococcus virescens TaxID=83456 RepID=A0A511HE13_9BACT|nr:hypothetical protein MVI01_35810 [Myxococcus virescens]
MDANGSLPTGRGSPGAADGTVASSMSMDANGSFSAGGGAPVAIVGIAAASSMSMDANGSSPP